MSKVKLILIGVFFIICAIFWYFNISLTSLPTTFPDAIKDNLANEKNFDEVDKLVISQGGTVNEEFDFVQPEDDRKITIKNKSKIYDLLNSDLCIYNGGRIEDTNKVFDIRIQFEDGNEHYYRIAKGYIFAFITDKDPKEYKVLDDKNGIFNYLNSLYNEK